MNWDELRHFGCVDGEFDFGDLDGTEEEFDDDDDDETGEESVDSEQDVADEAVDFCESMHVEQPTTTSTHNQRCHDAVEYCTKMLNGIHLSKYERDTLHCASQQYREARRRVLNQSLTGEAFTPETVTTTTEKPALLCDTPLTADEKKKKVFTVSRGGNTLLFIIENYVHVDYLVNSLTGELCNFSLVDIARSLIDECVELSDKKFAKVNWRIHDGLSFLIYTSSVIVETGSDNQQLSRRLLEKVISVVREKCGYPHINIKRRKCQNIVATGKLSYNVCMQVLKHKFTAAREKEGFTGLVIKHRDLVKFFVAEDDGDDGYEQQFTENYVDEDDDTEIIERINRVNDEKQLHEGSRAGPCRPGVILNEYGREEDEEEAIQRISKLIDEYAPKMNSARQNGTYILFPGGQVIATGCKSDRELVSGMPLLMRLTDRCSESSAENRRMEALLVAQKRATRVD